MALWFRHRHRRYGWTARAGDYSRKRVPLTLWERAADSNRVWLVCVIALVVAVTLLARIPERMGIRFPSGSAPVTQDMSSADDEAHRTFLREIESAQRYAAIVGVAFAGARDIRITFASPVADDDVYYHSKLVAYKAHKDLGVPCTVWAYLQSTTDQPDKLLATTMWEPEKYGYVVEFHRPTDL